MICISHLWKNYKELSLYEDFEVHFKKGHITALVGPSGGGKTTLLRLLAGLETYEKGKIIGLEDEVLAMVFQEDRLLNWFNVYENIAFTLKSYLNADECEARILEVLALMELDESKDAAIGQLSGGMQRRVALARALAADSTLILMDEPFKGLDPALKGRLLPKLKARWEAERKTVILITHDLEEAHLVADTCYELKGIPVKISNI